MLAIAGGGDAEFSQQFIPIAERIAQKCNCAVSADGVWPRNSFLKATFCETGGGNDRFTGELHPTDSQVRYSQYCQ